MVTLTPCLRKAGRRPVARDEVDEVHRLTGSGGRGRSQCILAPARGAGEPGQRTDLQWSHPLHAGSRSPK
jgi:hypothetical protein